MIVKKSRITGYCFGVENTIKKASFVLKKAKKEGKLSYSIGNLIHNEIVVKGFESQGLKVIKSADVTPGIALIRAHGIADAERKVYEDRGFVLVDSTCVNILATLKSIRKSIDEDRLIIVVGVESHAETNTLLGCGLGEKFLVTSAESLDRLYKSATPERKVAVAVQTTFSEDVYNQVSASISSYFSDVKFLNKLCSSCTDRKRVALEIANECDAVFVVGDVMSSNTKELATWIEQSKKPVYRISCVDDFDFELDNKIKVYKSVGVCSGTSTPENVIQDVCKHLELL